MVPGPGVGLALALAGAVLVGVGLVRTWRAWRHRDGWAAAEPVLGRAERRELLAQVRGRRPADPARLPLARVLAGQLAVRSGLALVLAGLCVLATGRWLLTGTVAAPEASAGAALVAAAVVGVLAHRDARRARHFLARHPAAGD